MFLQKRRTFCPELGAWPAPREFPEYQLRQPLPSDNASALLRTLTERTQELTPNRMTFRRHTMAIFIAGALLLGKSHGQDTSGTTPPPSNGASSSFGATPSPGTTSGGANPGTSSPSGSPSNPSGTTPGPGTPGAGPATPGNPDNTIPSFRTTPSLFPGVSPDNGVPPTNPLLPSPGGFGPVNPGANSTSPFSTNNINATPPPATQPGAASSFGGAGANGMQTQSAPVTYVIPGTYGSAPIRLTAGEGRLARPLFRFTATLGGGYDDNVLQTATRSPGVPARIIERTIAPATAAHTQVVQVEQADGNTVPETVEIPAAPATTVGVTVPGTPAPKRQGSFVNRGNVGTDVQFADRTTVFTLDLNAGADYYWERPGQKTDYNGTLALAFLHKFTPLLQTTANVNASYITQPNLGLVNTPTTNNVGPYLNFNARGDVSYRLMPRFSTVLSVSYATTYYTVPAQEINTFGTTTFGAELRYLFSPLLTMVGEVRYSSIDYANDSARTGTSDYLLGGVDLTLSRRLSATIRVGEQIRSFDGGGSTSSPFLELSSTYALSRTTSLTWNAHFGLEEPPDPTTTVQVLRSGLTLSQSLTPRVSSNLAFNLVHELSTEELTNVQSVQNTAEVSIGLTYSLSRRWTFSLSYTYDVLFSAGVASDYYRNRIFLTGNYAF